MNIRRAESGDLAQIVQIESLCFPEEAAFPPRMFAYLTEYAVCLVACQPEKKVLGFIMGYASGKAGAVYTLDVHPQYRRMGIGSSLISSLEEKLKRLGAETVRLEAAVERPEAIELIIRQATGIESWSETITERASMPSGCARLFSLLPKQISGHTLSFKRE